MKENRFQKIDRRTFLKAGSAVSIGAAAAFGNLGTGLAQSGPKADPQTSFEKIDMFPHILPKRFNEALLKKARPCYYVEANSTRPALADIDERLRFMDKIGGLRQVLTLGSPPPEYAFSSKDVVDMVKLANDGMAELVSKYPDRFPAAAASLPMTDVDASLREIDRAIGQLKLKGIQIFSSVNGKSLDRPEFLPIFEKMAQYDLPIWIHPCRDQNVADYPDEKTAKYGLFLAFGWPYESTLALGRLVFSGVMEKYPSLKIIAHHCAAMIPFLTARIAVEPFADGEITKLTKPPVEYFKRIYADTVLGGNTSAMMCGHSFFGPDHLLFGTDYPYPGEANHDAIIKAIGRMNITDEEKAKIYSKNARKLLKLE